MVICDFWSENLQTVVLESVKCFRVPFVNKLSYTERTLNLPVICVGGLIEKENEIIGVVSCFECVYVGVCSFLMLVEKVFYLTETFFFFFC